MVQCNFGTEKNVCYVLLYVLFERVRKVDFAHSVPQDNFQMLTGVGLR